MPGILRLDDPATCAATVPDPAHDDIYEEILADAAALRRQSLLTVERDGDARRLLFRGADHAEVRRWIDREQSLVGLLRFGDVRRAISGALCVWVAPVAPARAALELLTELSGE